MMEENMIEDRRPWSWNDQDKLAHSLAMAEKLIDRHPGIAEAWLKSADIIRKRMASRGT